MLRHKSKKNLRKKNDKQKIKFLQNLRKKE